MALGKCGRVPGLWKWPEVHADAQTCVNRGGHGRVFAGLGEQKEGVRRYKWQLETVAGT